MIIACPACSTRYNVPDSSIGENGRVVRCAKCRNSWFQDGPETTEAAAEPPEVPMPARAEAAPAPETADISPPPPVEPSAPADEADLAKSRDFAQSPSSFAHEPPFRPRRHRATKWVIAVILLALVVLAAIGAMARFGVPDWLPLPRSSFAQAQPDLVLDFPQGRQERRPLPNGSDFFNVSGSIHNIGRDHRTVPMLLIVLRNGHNDIVYSLETAPPKLVLAPGESEMVNQAIIDAPSSARVAEIGWKQH